MCIRGNEMTAAATLKVGLFGIGLDTYWPQFAGLKERLEGYQAEIAKGIGGLGDVDLVDVGLVDNPERSRTVGAHFREQQVDVIFLYISTYALSSTVLPVAVNCRRAALCRPVLLQS